MAFLSKEIQMNIKAALTILSAAALLTLAGCQQEQAPQQSLTGGLTKTSAAEMQGCPKFQKFAESYAKDIQTCSQQNVADCSPKLLKIFDPFLECLHIDKPTIKNADDLGKLLKEIGDKMAEFEGNPSKGKEFVECACGSVGGAAAVETQFTGNSVSATGSFNGNSSAATGSFNGTTGATTGSFNGSSAAASGSFGK